MHHLRKANRKIGVLERRELRVDSIEIIRNFDLHRASGKVEPLLY